MDRRGDERHDDVRRFLWGMAEEMPVSPAVPPGLRGRVARRAARTVAAGVLAVLVLMSSGVVGVRALVRRTIEPAGDCRAVFQWTPVPRSIGANLELAGVSAVSSHDVWAVGQRYEDRGPLSVPKAVALHWDGTAWSEVPTPVTGRRLGFSALMAVSGRAPDDVWAVGFSSPDGTPAGGGVTPKGGLHVLVEHWDGARWSMIRIPEPPSAWKAAFGLTGVVAAQTGEVWVGGAGYYPNKTGGGDRLLVERWDGTSWAVSTPPGLPPRTQGGSLEVVGPDDVWLLGRTVTPPIPSFPAERTVKLAMHWDGRRWARFDFPAVGEQDFLMGISASGPSGVWAVGRRLPPVGDHPVHALSFRWDGRAWREAPLDAGADDVGLSAVAAAPTGDVWAVGYSLRPRDPILLHRDEEADQWDRLPVEAPPDVERYSALTGVSALADGSFFAVGHAAEVAGGIGYHTRAIAGMGGCGG